MDGDSTWIGKYQFPLLGNQALAIHQRIPKSNAVETLREKGL